MFPLMKALTWLMKVRSLLIAVATSPPAMAVSRCRGPVARGANDRRADAAAAERPVVHLFRRIPVARAVCQASAIPLGRTSRARVPFSATPLAALEPSAAKGFAEGLDCLERCRALEERAEQLHVEIREQAATVCPLVALLPQDVDLDP